MAGKPKRLVTDALVTRRQELVDYARRRVGAAAEDVVQDAALRALKKAEQLSNPRAARAWLFTIVRRVIAERREAEPVNASPPEPERVVDGCDCIVAQVRALPPAQASLLTRVVVEGVSVSALADELGITQNNAWVRLHRARQALKAQVAQHCGTKSLRQCLDCGCIERGCCQPQS
jgi:RNA polymerase sigma factor (sigma-70 family)